jgi:hypothetical protein
MLLLDQINFLIPPTHATEFLIEFLTALILRFAGCSFGQPELPRSPYRCSSPLFARRQLLLLIAKLLAHATPCSHSLML